MLEYTAVSTFCEGVSHIHQLAVRKDTEADSIIGCRFGTQCNVSIPVSALRSSELNVISVSRSIMAFIDRDVTAT